MNIQELAAYNSHQQAQFQPTLSPDLWTPREHLKQPVHDQILFGAEAYCAELGLAQHQVVDVAVSGAMAGYTHTNCADIDVIIQADLDPDPVFREFFAEHCHSYNQQSAMKIGRHTVKFYIQPAEAPIVSRGTYSLLSESWLQVAQRRPTEDNDTVMAFKQAEQAAQPAQSKPAVKKRIVRERRPTVYGYGVDRDTVSENKLQQFKIFMNNFANDFKLPEIINNNYILDHMSTTDIFISEYNSAAKKKITKYVWDLPEKLKKYNLTTEDVYKSTAPYNQITRHVLRKELPGNRIKLKESVDDATDIVKKITTSLGLATQPPELGDKVDIVDVTVFTMSDRIEIAVKSNEIINQIKGDLYSTAGDQVGYLGTHPGAEGTITSTYFAPANSVEKNKTMLALKSAHNNDGLELDGWKINYSSDSITKKLSHIFKEHFNKLINEVGVTPDGVSASTCMFANEQQVEPQDPKATVEAFVQFCSDQLGLEREPDLRVRRDPAWSQRARTFGRYNPATNQLEVSLANRHIMDILRTVAHELTHQHQHERESVPDHAGDTGSEWENEANARAGILMRDYAQSHPDLFDYSNELSESWKNWAAAGLATAALAGGAQPAQAQSVQQGLGAIQNIGTAVNTFRGVDWNAMLRSEAGQALYNYILANGGNPNSQNQSALYQWQRQMQQDRAAQPQQSAPELTQQAAPASATTSMYNDILRQQGRANTNESSGHITPNKLFCRKVNSKEELIEHAKKLSCALDTDRPITHLNRYTVVCSTLFTMARANLVESNVPEFINSVKDFINVLNKFDEFKKLNIKVGSKVAIISCQALGDSVEVWGFINPKTITNITRDPNDQSIKQFEFNNDPSDVWPRSDNAEYNGNFLTNSAFFGSKDSAEKALLWALTTKKDNISISNHIKENIIESSGYIPTAAQADDPRFEMALTTDVRPGATGKNANKLRLNTDAQGRPQELRADGMVKRMMEEYKRFKV